jgi:hypothetical protein
MKIATVSIDQLDPMIQDKIYQLQMAKQASVEAEDFDQAKFYKTICDKLLVLGSQLHGLYREKDAAINAEDYDAAKRIKHKIEELSQIAARMQVP